MHTMKKKEKFFGLLGISTVSIISFGSIYTNSYINNVSATTQTKTTSTNAAIRVRSTCSMTATIDSGNEHTATMINGQYKENIGLTTITTFCNDPNGYAIYAIGYTGGDTGVAAGTNTVLHSNALGSTYDIVTGIATSGDISNWAMKVSSVSGTYAPTIESDTEGSFSNYHTVPQSYTKVAKFNTSTDATIGSSLTTTYAVYVKPTQPAGTYEGQVKYVLLHPASSLEPGTYYMQDVDEWGSQVAIGQEITAYDNRDNKSYTVRRMCMEGIGNTWQEKELDCSKSMLWMTQNLDLDLARGTLLNSEDTDLNVVGSGAYSTDYTTDSNGIIYWNPATTTITSINTSTGKFNGWANNNNVAYSADPDAGNPNNPWYATGEVYNSNLCYVNSNNQTCNYLNSNNTVAPTYFSHTPFVSNGNHGKIGNYYNWPAAIASNNSSSLTTSTYNDVTNNPKNSICPKGWRLPIISSVVANSEFTRLSRVYNGGSISKSTGLVGSPVYMIQSGYVNDSLNNSGYIGIYWSSTADNANVAYSMYFRSNVVSTSSNNGSRLNGRSVRCVSDY